MNREELSNIICSTVIKEENKMSLSDMEKYSITNTDDYKSGLYFLYNKSNVCIYVGMVGGKESATLYMRMVGNGNAAHTKEKWHDEIDYGYWHKFNVSDEDVETIERLAIYGMKQPIYNDKDTDQEAIDRIAKALKL